MDISWIPFFSPFPSPLPFSFPFPPSLLLPFPFSSLFPFTLPLYAKPTAVRSSCMSGTNLHQLLRQAYNFLTKPSGCLRTLPTGSPPTKRIYGTQPLFPQGFLQAATSASAPAVTSLPVAGAAPPPAAAGAGAARGARPPDPGKSGHLRLSPPGLCGFS